MKITNKSEASRAVSPSPLPTAAAAVNARQERDRVRAALRDGSAQRQLDASHHRLPPEFSSRFSAALGSEVGDVRLHTDAAAGEAAVGLGARAFTVGDDVYFAPGQYQPSTRFGQQIIAHEVAHVMQQRSSVRSAGGIAHLPVTSEVAERQAEAAAQAMVLGRTAVVSAQPMALACLLQEGRRPLSEEERELPVLFLQKSLTTKQAVQAIGAYQELKLLGKEQLLDWSQSVISVVNETQWTFETDDDWSSALWWLTLLGNLIWAIGPLAVARVGAQLFLSIVGALMGSNVTERLVDVLSNAEAKKSIAEEVNYREELNKSIAALANHIGLYVLPSIAETLAEELARESGGQIEPATMKLRLWHRLFIKGINYHDGEAIAKITRANLQFARAEFLKAYVPWQEAVLRRAKNKQAMEVAEVARGPNYMGDGMDLGGMALPPIPRQFVLEAIRETPFNVHLSWDLGAMTLSPD